MTRREAVYAALETLSHPDRLVVLERCAQAPTSPKLVCVFLADLNEVEDGQRREWIKGRLGSIAYHTRTALDHGLIKKHSQRQVRGAVENLYVTSAAGRRLLDSLDLDADQ